MIIIVDYGLGNLQSIQSKIERLGYKDVRIAADAGELERAAKLILPGVGHFAEGMKNIRQYGLLEVLNRKVLQDKVPVLGICLGMQLLTRHSEEGDVDGLGWIDGVTKRFNFSMLLEKPRVPHVGWNSVSFRTDSLLSRGLAPDQRFYFTHSYCVSCDSEQDAVGTTHYGYDFVSVVQKGNIFGTQFHPEKSHKHGLQMIDNFLRFA